MSIDSAALLVDEVLPHQPMRQWVLSVPFSLRFLFASNPKVMTRVLGIIIASIEDPVVISTILAHLDKKRTSAGTSLLPDCRASPTVGLFV